MALTVEYVSNTESVYETGKPQRRYSRTASTSSQKTVGNVGDTYEAQQKVKFDEQGYPIPYGKELTLKEGFWFLSKDEYTYTANGRESIGDIKAKFHIKDNAIKRCQPYIRSDEYVPQRGIKISFYKEDIIVK